MKRILFLVFAPMLIGGCDDDTPYFEAPSILMHSFMPEYEESVLSIHQSEDNQDITEKCYLYCTTYNENHSGSHIVYKAPELGATGEEAERFLEIAQRNGDRSYDRYESIAHWAGRKCGSDNYKTLHVRCLNAAWDDTHPADTSLDDIVQIHYYSYADYVRRGYPEGETPIKEYRIPLEDVAKNNLSMLSPRIRLYFTNTPAAGSYEMEITFVTTEDVEKKATCTLVIE